MKIAFTYTFLLLAFPALCLSQPKYKVQKRYKKAVVGGSVIDVHDPGISISTLNAIFLVPIDTIGNLSFTGVINGIKVIGKFKPHSCWADTIMVMDPLTNEGVLICDSIYKVAKHGEWNYYCDDGLNYREYYDNGNLIQRDSLESSFIVNNKEIKIVDSMERIRSIIDLYIKRGDKSAAH